MSQWLFFHKFKSSLCFKALTLPQSPGALDTCMRLIISHFRRCAFVCLHVLCKYTHTFVNWHSVCLLWIRVQTVTDMWPFCHPLNRALKGYIKFNEGSRCQVLQPRPRSSPHIFSPAASILLSRMCVTHVTYIFVLSRHLLDVLGPVS